MAASLLVSALVTVLLHILGYGGHPVSAADASINCCVVDSFWPQRTCTCVSNTCQGVDQATADGCFICQRGWGVYPSMQACQAPPAGATAGIDPSTYPVPTFPTPTCTGASTPNPGPAVPQQAAADGQPDGVDCPWLWPGLKPWESLGFQAGKNVTLPLNTRVLLSSCSIQPGVVYPSITVPQTSELIFANKDIAINVGVIYIHGSLRMGGPACRMTSRVTITFPASKTLKPLYQGIFLQEGGQLDIHGKLFTPTWTRLAKTANPGDTVISLQDAVNWQAGQQIFITTTIWRDEDMNQNEVLVIKAVSADGRQLTLGGAVKYSHYGGPEYQAEVGLLSRNILLQGDPSTYNTLRGGQVKIMGQGRIRGTQAYRMGQYNIVGAAPFHWYMTGASPNSTVTDSSVYRSFYRCYEFHAVSQMRIASNVAFDAPGHCFQFENGVEENHTVDRNLAAFVHPIGQAAGGITQAGNVYKQSDQLPNPSDASASGFFFPSAFNRITNNAASGGWAGFMFPVLLSPIQENQAQTYINPSTRPFIRFDGNSAHSSGYMWSEGACIYAGGRLYTNYSDAAALYFSSGRYDHATRDASGANSDFMRFSITKVFLCQSGLTHFGDRAEVDGLRAYDCTRGATLTGQALLTNSLINLQSGNAQSGFPGDLTTLWPLAGFEFPESGGMTIITNTTFANFKYQPQQGATRQAVFRAAVNTDEFKPSGSAATRNISYINTAPQAIFNIRVGQAGSSRFANWLDTDGSAVQRPGAAIVGSWPEWWHLSSAYCNYQDAWNAWVCSQQAGQAVARLDMRISGLTIAPGQGIGIPPTPAATIGTAGLFGQPGYTVDITTNEGTVGVTGSTGWFATFTAGAPQNLAIALTQVPTGTSIMFATPYPTGTTFAIQRTASPASLMGALSPATSLDAVTGGNGMQYSFDGKNLFIKLVDPGDASSAAGNFVRDGVTIYGSRGWTLVYQIRSSLQCGSYPNAICPLPAGSVAIPAPVSAPPSAQSSPAPPFSFFVRYAATQSPAGPGSPVVLEPVLPASSPEVPSQTPEATSPATSAATPVPTDPAPASPVSPASPEATPAASSSPDPPADPTEPFSPSDSAPPSPTAADPTQDPPSADPSLAAIPSAPLAQDLPPPGTNETPAADPMLPSAAQQPSDSNTCAAEGGAGACESPDLSLPGEQPASDATTPPPVDTSPPAPADASATPPPADSSSPATAADPSSAASALQQQAAAMPPAKRAPRKQIGRVPTQPTPPSANTTATSRAAPSTPSAAGTSGFSSPSIVPPYQQCGGRSGPQCGADACGDTFWAVTCSDGYACQRLSEWYYQCLPSSIVSPALSGSPASAAQPSAEPEAPTAAFQTGSAARKSLPTPGNKQTDPAPQQPGAAPQGLPPAAAGPAVDSPASSSGVVAAVVKDMDTVVLGGYQQCGGMSPQTCSAYQCKDTAWLNIECAAGFVCLRQNAWYWQCIADQDAAATAAQWLAFPGNAPQSLEPAATTTAPASPGQECVPSADQEPGDSAGSCLAPDAAAAGPARPAGAAVRQGAAGTRLAGVVSSVDPSEAFDPYCKDIQPPVGPACQDLKLAGKCTSRPVVDNNYCAATCGYCFKLDLVSTVVTPPGTSPSTPAATPASPGTSPSPIVIPSSPNAPTAPVCVDLPPDGTATCQQQQAWGKCTAAWMQQGKFCQVTCGTCPTTVPAPPASPTAQATPVPASPQCGDVQPPGSFTCQQQKGWGKCTEAWMQPYCQLTCGTCVPNNPPVTSDPPTPPAPAAPAGAAPLCVDVQPPGSFTCQQQQSWGKCTEAWMQPYCQLTCGTCASSNAPVMPAAPNCVDIQPPGAYTCAMQKTYGKCSAPWMQAGNFCAATCGTCGGGGGAVPAPPQCTDVAPPGPYTCAQQKSFNKCSAQWMAPYCAQTCGRC